MKTARDIKLLAFDLDGTFLAPDRSVTPRARRAILSLRERGIEPVPTTGRAHQKLFSQVLGMDGFRYVIAANGAVVLDVEKNVYFVHEVIAADVAADLVRELERPGVVTYTCLDDEAGTRIASCESLEVLLDIMGYNPWDEPIVEHAADRIESEGIGALKVGAHFCDRWRYEDFSPLAGRFGLEHAASATGNAEFGPLGVTKATGLRALSRAMGLDLREVCAIGDAGNDADMLRTAGLGVAMGNATDEARAAADMVARPNSEDGFADFVERYLLS
ncbi:HAD family hydrolase [Thermophilibacter provencensis]|uniref:HAD family hydrolase n=1 Tax=Thermophilibacter provencensis TaxID=1852386 RepID=A0ABT7V356_9ACTN|nr:HAD family hydrolase [Thermophilibacter provencensis]MDM8271036.1 HAD family hydrolase [Thermophilibacter provencensis]